MANNNKVRLAETSIERTARLLSQQFGIKVVWKTGECKTDGNVIYLPTLPPNAPDDLLAAVHGFLDHETAHVLFTDFKTVNSFNPAPTETQFHCINVVEDIRIESAICGLFPGSSTNLQAANDWVIPRIIRNWNKVNQFMRACAAYGNYVAYGADTDFWKKTVDLKTKQLVAECVTAVGPAEKITSTKLAIEAGLRMYEVLKDYAKEEEAARKNREKQKQNNELKVIKGEIPSEVEIVSKEQLGEALGQQAAVIVANIGKKTSKSSGYQHDVDSADSTYIVYSTAGDTISSLAESNLRSSGSRLIRLRDEARELTNTIRMRLVNSLRAKSRRRWVGGKDEGKVDSRRLYQVAVGETNNVYKQLTDKVHLNTAVCLAIDHSGSMAGRKLELACEAAVVLGDALSTLRVPFAVYGYSTDKTAYAPVETSPYARWNKLWIRYYRDFDESWEKGAVRLAAGHVAQNNTLDAESVKHGIQRLLARREKRKILFVFNDGLPNPGHGNTGRCQKHLKSIVAAASAAGVEVVAFGIEDDDVKYYYPNYVIIKSLKDLTKEPLQVLDNMLRKGVRAK